MVIFLLVGERLRKFYINLRVCLSIQGKNPDKNIAFDAELNSTFELDTTGKLVHNSLEYMQRKINNESQLIRVCLYLVISRTFYAGINILTY